MSRGPFATGQPQPSPPNPLATRCARGRGEQPDFEGYSTDGDLLTMLNGRASIADRTAIDERAVCAAEISDEPAGASADESGVAAGNGGVGDDDRVGSIPADGHGGPKVERGAEGERALTRVDDDEAGKGATMRARCPGCWPEAAAEDQRDGQDEGEDDREQRQTQQE